MLYPYLLSFQCWLKQQKDALNPDRVNSAPRDNVMWTSGFVFNKGEVRIYCYCDYFSQTCTENTYLRYVSVSTMFSTSNFMIESLHYEFFHDIEKPSISVFNLYAMLYVHDNALKVYSHYTLVLSLCTSFYYLICTCVFFVFLIL